MFFAKTVLKLRRITLCLTHIKLFCPELIVKTDYQVSYCIKQNTAKAT